MYKIWFCELYDEYKENDDYALSYIKVLYEDIKYDELEHYIDYICKILNYKKGKRFGCDNQCLELISNSDKKYCLFFEEELEEDENV